MVVENLGIAASKNGGFLKTLVLDIETSPILAWTWGLWNQNIQPKQIVHPSSLLCWAAKWLGEPDVEWRGRKPDGHRKMVRRIWKLLDEADAVIHYNGKRFDIPRIQREFIKAGLGPPAPYKQIDLLVTARKQFQFDSNKLEEVAKSLGIGKKDETGGFGLWLRCLDGESSAWDKMRHYNVQDVRLTERVYVEKLRPWVVGHPSHSAFAASRICPKCESAKLERRGFAVLATGRYQRLHCVKCGAWSRETKRLDATEVVQLA